MLRTRSQQSGYGGLWSEMTRLQEEMDRLFGRFGAPGGRRQVTPAYPAFNIWQDDNNLYCEAELPGMELEDLEIYVTGGDQLTIKGRRREPIVEQGVWHRRERGAGRFVRTLTLPQGVDAERVEARLCCGVLVVTLPKREEAKPRRIDVKAG